MALYKQDPNNTNKQIPDGTPGGTARYSHATCPKVATKQNIYTYIVFNNTVKGYDIKSYFHHIIPNWRWSSNSNYPGHI